MAKLSQAQILELIKTPKNKVAIAQAMKQEERLLLHCEPIMNIEDLPYAYREFINWIATFLPKEKLSRFESLVRLPLDTVDDTKSIFTQISKVYNAQNRFLKWEFVNPDLEQDFATYAEDIGDDYFWQTEGFDALRIAINSMLVVDLPSKQTSPLPKPYYYLVSTKDFVDIVYDDKGCELEYFIYKSCIEENDRDIPCIVALDEEYYRVFTKNVNDEWTFYSESIHSVYNINDEVISGIGYIPATAFYNDKIKTKDGLKKKGIITNSLAALDWCLFMKISKKYLDLYGAWPITVTYKKTCQYRDEFGNECLEGYINYSTPNSDGATPPKLMQRRCPVCESSGMIGAGSFWTVDPPKDKDDVDLMINPVKFIEISNDKLDYGVDETERLTNTIYLKCVGNDRDPVNNQAVNEKQVMSFFDSRESVLDRIRTAIEESHKFVMDTICRIRYGDYFVKSTVFYGNEYFLKTESDLIDEYNTAKTAGLPFYIVARMREQISRTKHKNNPEQLLRDLILSNLEPYPDLTLAQIQALQLNLTDPDLFILKINFPSLIARFERENTNVVQFGSLIPFAQKITIIQTKLLLYVADIKSKQVKLNSVAPANSSGNS